MAITKDFVADYGADNTGVASVTTKLYTNLKTDMQGQDVNLTFPAGSYNNATFGGDGGSWINGALDLNVTATGATLFGDGGVFLSTSHLAQIGIDASSQTPAGFTTAGGKSARIQTVNAGATSVTLTAASAAAGHISRFSVGQWMMVCGLAIQSIFLGSYGFPPNFQWHDFVKITNITGDTITFDRALTSYYSSAWPEMNRGTEFEVDSGGPATIFALSPFWAGNTTFNGGTYTNGNLINCYRENFTMNGGTSSGFPIYPSVQRSWSAINHTATAALVEHDKLVDLVTIQGGEYSQWKCQSSSTKLLQMDGVTIGSGGINGTPRNTTVNNCTISGPIVMGPVSYGAGETFRCTNTSISGSISSASAVGGALPSYVTMANGIITIPISTTNDVVRVFVPDAYGRNVFFWQTNTTNTTGTSKVLGITSDVWPAADNQTATTNVTINASSNVLQVSSSIFAADDVGKVIVVPNGHSSSTYKGVITQYNSANEVLVGDNFTNTLAASSKTIQWGTCNIYVQTNDTGGFPSSKLISGYSFIRVRSNGVRSVYFENCTGSEQAVDLSQVGAQNKPYASYTKRTYTGQMPTAASSGNRLSAAGAVAGTGSKVQMIGTITSLKINVITPYTGSGVPGALTAGIAQFGVSLNVNGTSTGFNPRINVKIAGERVFTPGVAATGGQSGDTLPTLPAGAWINNGFDPVLSTNITSEYLADTGVGPVFTIEMITDQGISTGPTAVVPLRMRLRSA